VHQLNIFFAQAIEILPKINAFNQYYLRKQELVVMRFIPPPNSSSSFEVSAIFWDCNFNDIRRNATNLWNYI